MLVSDSHREPLMTPGAGRNERLGPMPGSIAIAAALFSDGSHEGDSDSAAKLKSGRIGYETQEGRALQIIDHVVGDPALDDNARITQINTELTELSNEPDDRAIRTMHAQFPDLPADVIRKDLIDAFHLARVNIWSEVYGYVHSSGEYPPPLHAPPLAEWLQRRR